ncbi:ribosomal protein L5 domain-containing protein [Leucosporidium creatinivorum]|uniref:Ribosomal protein L5 domain-containing protein n=1 Tax=Leucosporidium creatinivorum TaxID=106004 RepID=A0A1Y2C8I3_9BASI|nr:ribosomal protein L5 domain-containing protein [Leucosporidium creatinivorum]
MKRVGSLARVAATRPAATRISPAVLSRPFASSSSSSSPADFHRTITPGPTSRSRLKDHYNQTLSHDLLYTLYSHATHTNADALPNPSSRSPMWSPENPYALNRPPPRPKGNRYLVPNPSYTSPESLPVLESIVVETMTTSALSAKSNLLPLLMAYQAITGEVPQSRHPGPYGPGSGKGLVITRSAKKSASFKVRAGAPTGVKVELRGESMYSFLETLVDFVLPRLKTFSGIPLPPASHPRQSPSSTSGVVSFGLPPEAMGLFPQIEINLDQYPKTFGMNIFCVTSARGRGAQDQARALLSGFGAPFVKRG